MGSGPTIKLQSAPPPADPSLNPAAKEAEAKARERESRAATRGRAANMLSRGPGMGESGASGVGNALSASETLRSGQKRDGTFVNNYQHIKVKRMRL